MRVASVTGVSGQDGCHLGRRSLAEETTLFRPDTPDGLAKASAAAIGRIYRSNPAFWRPTEAVPLVADAAKARQPLGWEPSLDFVALVDRMVDAELAGPAETAR
ncbi:MAG TPA: GDP-mannose 4,6-dehydratase [Thermomicrobiales bacterium]|nr:GDP-mannose 4,6-dehydratase [Thermomicrobiales bacterium]